MRIFFSILILFTHFIFLSGCASKIVLKSEPTEADVFVTATGKSDKIAFGKTPIVITSADLQSKTGIDSSSSEFFEITFEKKDHVPEKIIVPIGRMGSLETIILVKLKEGKEETKVVTRILNHILNANRFSSLGEFARAHEEIDKALLLNSEFSRALSFKGSIYFMQKQYSESLKWFEKALKAEPEYEDATRMIGHIQKIVNGATRSTSSEVDP